MFKKVVPLAALLSSAVAVDNFVQNSQWTGGVPPTFSGTAGSGTGAAAASATNCCFLTGAVTISAANVLSGTANSNSACAAYTPQNGVVSVTLNAPTAADTATSSANPGATVTTDPTGVASIDITLDNPTAVTGGSPVCKQTISTRANPVAPADLAGTWTIGAAGSTTGSASTCCYFDPTTKMTFAKSASNVITTSGAKTQTQATNANCPATQTEYTKTLNQLIGDTSSAVPLSYNGDKFTLNTAKTQLNYYPGGNTACVQVFTKDTTSSALKVALAPVVVGATVMGLVL